MGGGISVCNKTGVEVIVALSQVGPLHWIRVRPGETKKINCGKVWFTVNAKLWDGSEPSDWDVAKPFVIGIGAAAVVVGVAAVIAVAAVADANLDGIHLDIPIIPASAAVDVIDIAATTASAASAGGAGSSSSLSPSRPKTAHAIGAATDGDRSIVTVAGVGTGVGLIPPWPGDNSAEGIELENAKKWLTKTPSVESANWLAKNNIIAVVPGKKDGVYADGKTITVSHALDTSSGGLLMTLKLTYTEQVCPQRENTQH